MSRILRFDVEAEGRVAVYSFTLPSVIRVGRSSECDLVLPYRGVSRQHCEIVFRDAGRAELRDRQSANGTHVDGRAAHEAELRDGTVIGIGPAIIRVAFTQDPGETVPLTEGAPRPAELATAVDRCAGCGAGPLRVPYWHGRYALCRACAASIAQLAPFARFNCVQRIGQGSAGTVYKAYMTDGRAVAVKLISFTGEPDPDQVARLHRELQISLSLKHPGIVETYETGSGPGCCFIVMELVVGRSLLDRVAQDGTLDAPAALSFARGMLESLAYAHSRAVMHRDVKPQNLLVTEGGGVKLLDFGLAKVLDESALTQLTRTNEGLGTPYYMPPEQIRNARDADFGADIYSAGATLSYALTGRPPFSEGRPTVTTVLKRVQIEPPPDVCAARSDLPPRVGEVVKRAMAKHASERYQSALEMLEALERAFASG